jgi:heme exporter protein C
VGSYGLLKCMEKLAKSVLLVGVPLATLHSYFVKDARGFLYPEFARVFFWHFPCPMMATVLLCAGLFFSIRYSQTRDLRWDARAVAAHELAMVFILLTMISGIFFSRIQWNAWWQNDPRQVSFLLVIVLYTAYFVLRTALADSERRAVNSGAYAIAAFLPFVYLTFVYPRLPQVINNHPNESIMKGNIKGGYLYVVLELLVLVGAITYWAYRLRSRAGILQIEIEKHGDLQSSIGATGNPPVVRPVPLSDQS